jgi:pantoate--beta-alanine ligase
MGALHTGHASLVKASQQDNDLTIVSIFVNPTQFNQPEDLTLYPRTLDADLTLLEQLSVDACFIPETEQIYNDNYRFQLTENHLSQQMEGHHRPGHFTGVLTVVMKLLNLIQPTRAYFGEKDFQQLQLIQQMVTAFFMTVDIIGCPTLRESSGLPYSSRNQRLTPAQRLVADEFARIFHQNASLESIKTQLSALDLTIDYLEEHQQRRFIAVSLGNIRLIDNLRVDQAPN